MVSKKKLTLDGQFEARKWKKPQLWKFPQFLEISKADECCAKHATNRLKKPHLVEFSTTEETSLCGNLHKSWQFPQRTNKKIGVVRQNLQSVVRQNFQSARAHTQWTIRLNILSCDCSFSCWQKHVLRRHDEPHDTKRLAATSI